MNKSLNALMTKLNWQLNELNAQLLTEQNGINALQVKITEIEEVIQRSGFNSLMINPELEINRLNFITQQHERRDTLHSQQKNHQEIAAKLQEKIQRINTELKMLEKYLEREQKAQTEQQKKTEDNALDEWVIQQRKPNED
jgi:flagellar biosynthesis chaperone FliJ